MLVLPDAVTHANAVACLADFSHALAGEAGAEVVLDAAPLARFDSAALAVLLELRRKLLKTGKTLVLKDAPPGLQNLAALYGIADLLQLKP